MYVLGACARCSPSLSYARCRVYVPDESSPCCSPPAASPGAKEKEEESVRQRARGPRARERKVEIKGDGTFANATERVCARYEGEGVREPERCVGSDRSSSFEARQRTSEQPRNRTAIERTHAIFAKIKRVQIYAPEIKADEGVVSPRDRTSI